MGEGGSFACPECGNELTLKGTSAGRQLRCNWCETWVEVPFLPRAVVRRTRFSRGRPRWVAWTWWGLAALTLLLVVFGTRGILRTRNRQRIERNLTARIADATAEERAGRFEAAVKSIHAALAEAARLEPQQRPARMAELEELRDRFVRRAAVAQIESAAKATPGEAIATYKALLARTWREGTLEGLEGTLREKLERTRRQWAEADLAAAKQAVVAGLPDEAIDLCERSIKTAEELAPAVQNPLQNQANAIVAALIDQRGVIYDQPQGQFTLGTPQSYRTALQPVLGPVLRQHGYLTDRPSSSWHSLWTTRAPYHFSFDVVERQHGDYLNTKSQLSILSLRMMLSRNGSSIWQAGPLQAQTQPSIPSLSAFTASRFATDERRRAEFERVLYDDAQATLMAKVQFSLRSFLDIRPSTP
ncbi:hypothetical protein V5E97_01455 [Singulisphaera sp. Ch08]|uniref:Uncharacterized protein n=1 Tax=Singulisphaera sp. Ch08 TaxID=3120278 RepID=A0AAU7CI75_9BACT